MGSTPTTFAIDDDRSRLNVRFSPALPGFKMRLTGIRGNFVIDLRDDGSVDMDGDASGAFAAGVSGLKLGNPVLTKMGRRWLDDGTDRPIKGAIGDSSAVKPETQTYELELVLTMKGVERQLTSLGTINQDGDELVVEGLTEIRPDDIGFPFPLPGQLKAISKFDIRLVRTDSE